MLGAGQEASEPLRAGMQVAEELGALVQLTASPVAVDDRPELSPTATHVRAPSPAVPDMVQHVVRSPGRTLDTSTRAYLEPRFGHDFSRVQIHDDAGSRATARGLHAAAYTVGRHITFARSVPSVAMAAGRSLLAHELTHVVQQERGGRPPRLSPGAPHEREAEAATRAIASGVAAVQIGEATGIGLARSPDDPARAASDLPARLLLEGVVALNLRTPREIASFEQVVDAYVCTATRRAFLSELKARNVKLPTAVSDAIAGTPLPLATMTPELERMLYGPPPGEPEPPVSRAQRPPTSPPGTRQSARPAPKSLGERWAAFKADVDEEYNRPNADGYDKARAWGRYSRYVNLDELEQMLVKEPGTARRIETYHKFYDPGRQGQPADIHFYQGTPEDPLVTGIIGGAMTTARASEFRDAQEAAANRDTLEKMEGVATGGPFATAGRVLGAVTGLIFHRDWLASSEIGGSVGNLFDLRAAVLAAKGSHVVEVEGRSEFADRVGPWRYRPRPPVESIRRPEPAFSAPPASQPADPVAGGAPGASTMHSEAARTTEQPKAVAADRPAPLKLSTAAEERIAEFQRQVPGVIVGSRRRAGVELINKLSVADRKTLITALAAMDREQAGKLLTRIGMFEGAEEMMDFVRSGRAERERHASMEISLRDEASSVPEVGAMRVKTHVTRRVTDARVQAGRSALRKAMKAEPPVWAHGNPDAWEAHHIIPVELQDHWVFDVLRGTKKGWDHNDARVNGIALPTTPEAAREARLPLHQVTKLALEAAREEQGSSEPIPAGVVKDLRGHPNVNRDIKADLDALEPFTDDPTRLRQEVLRIIDNERSRILGDPESEKPRPPLQ